MCEKKQQYTCSVCTWKIRSDMRAVLQRYQDETPLSAQILCLGCYDKITDFMWTIPIRNPDTAPGRDPHHEY